MKLLKCGLIFLMMMLVGCQSQEIAKQPSLQKEVTVTPFQEDQCYQYHYQFLTEKQQQLYEDMFNIFINGDKEGKVSNNNIKDINTVHEALLYDHPELFYVEKEIIYDDYRLEPVYAFSKQEIETYQQQLEQKKQEILQLLPQDDDYAKMKFIYDYVIKNVHYDENAKNNQLLISGMIDQSTVCMGYAKMMQYLLQAAGVNTTLIVGGFIDNNNQVQRHAWNMVEYQQDYYYIDATWGDDEDNNMILDEYFMFHSDNMLKSYKPETEYETTQNEENTYFKKNGLYFQNFDLSQISNAVDRENRLLEIQLSQDIYEYGKNRIMNSNDAFDILSQANIHEKYIHYSYNDNFQVIRVMW